MKNLFLLICSLFFISNSFAQTDADTSKRQRKTTIFVETYKPVSTNSVKYFDNFITGSPSGNNSKRDFKLYAVGLGFETVLKNSIVIRPRLGLSVIDLTINIDSEFSDFPEENGFSKSSTVYEQTYINLFLGLSKRIQLNNDFNIDFGVDLSVISYLEGTRDHYSISSSRAPEFGGRSQQWSTTDYGKATSYGIGPIIKPEYKLKMGLSISFEVQYYFMRTSSNSQISIYSRDEFVYTQMGIEYPQESESMRETNLDFSEWSWSEFSPLIRLGYSF